MIGSAELRAAIEAGEPLAPDAPAGHPAVRGGAVVGFLPARRAFRIGGADRHDFLHRMLTAAIRPAPPGSGRRTLLLDNKGRLQADIDLFEEDDALIALTAGERAVAAFEGLARFVLRADVRFERLPLRVLALVGPEAAGLLPAASAPTGERPALRRTELAGVPLRAAATSGLPQGLELLVEPERAPAVAEKLCAAGAAPTGVATLEMLRIEAGIPAAEREGADAPFPQELRLEAAVAFDKGCYVGQETVARIHYRGQVNRLLCGLVLEGAAAPGELESREGRAAGAATSTAVSEQHGAIALGLVRREFSEPGTGLLLRGDDGATTTARVAELPFG